MQLSAEQIEKNWHKHLKIVDTFITGERKQKLLDLYQSLSEEMVMAPASGRAHYHNAFPGGYIDHVNRVVQCAMKISAVWHDMGAQPSFTDEELVFAALNHDLGKVGGQGTPGYIRQEDKWRQDKLGEMYTPNTSLSFMLVPDRSLYILQQAGITVTENEYLAIKLHDGLYSEANKAYYISNNPESKLRSNISYVLHQADILASNIEYSAWKSNKPQDTSNAVKASTSTGKQVKGSASLLGIVKDL